MRRRNYRPQHWELEVDLLWTMVIHSEDMVILNPQGDFLSGGGIGHPNDLEGQTDRTIELIHDMLDEAGCGEEDITNLRVEYVTDGGVDEDAYRSSIAAQLPRAEGATIEFLPFDRLVYPELVVEIDTYGMLTQDGERLARTIANPDGLYHPGAPFAQGVRSGNMIYVGGQVARDAAGRVLHPGDIVPQSEIVLENIGKVLAELGADYDDVVRFNTFYVGTAMPEAWAEHARVRAGYFKEPGPAMTAIPLPRLSPEGAVIMMCCWAMLGADGARLPRQSSWPEGHWDWPIHLPWKHGVKCGNMAFVGGQVSMDEGARVIGAGDHVAQTVRSMENIDRVLKEFGLCINDVHKTNSYYVLHTVDEFHENLETRAKFFETPGPASVGLPLDTLAYPDMMVEIEAIAMAD